MEGKNAVFQKLKPLCVKLSQSAVALNGSRADIKALTDKLDDLKYLLTSITSKPNALDPKLAEYVFFPISQILKASKNVPIRTLELCLQCVAILVEQGWGRKLQPQLAAQLVILCSLLGERQPKGLAFIEATDELQASAFWCLYHVFSILDNNTETAKLLTSESNFPQLGQTISVLLDGMERSESMEVQIAATDALKALLFKVTDRDIQATFLPGIVSKLTRILMPQKNLRRSFKVLTGCLSVLEVLLRNTMSDRLRTYSDNEVVGPVSQDGHDRGNSIITEKWQGEAASQLKPALTNIVKLRAHSKHAVQEALSSLCMMLLRSCRETLANCCNMALETVIAISAARSDSANNLELEVLVSTDLKMSALLLAVVYDKLHSLTTIMQGSDEAEKASTIQQIAVGYVLISKARTDTSTIDRMLATTLRDSIAVILHVRGMKRHGISSIAPIQSIDLNVLDYESDVEFESPLVRLKGQERPMMGLERLTQLVSMSLTSSGFATDLSRSLHQTEGDLQIANFWLLLTAVQTAVQGQDPLHDFVHAENESYSPVNEHLEELYSFSLSILTEPLVQEPDPRLVALALRSLALRAQTAGRHFRSELVDALYPVLHTLATSDEILQRDSITTLNVFASACDYGSVRDLVVENVDYLTNAVALKLNSFDVSPQAPQVLLMMVRLAGSTLLPYLEDTIESIFAALEGYHGYPLLVELLFKVLAVIAEEGAQAPQLALTVGNLDEMKSLVLERWQPIGITDLGVRLCDHALQQSSIIEDGERGVHPKRPWKEIEETEDEIDELDELQTDAEQPQQVDGLQSLPPVPKTYDLVLKITELTQHFLPSASATLRVSLLSLICTTIPAIAKHEDSFLPLVNTLWPEVVSRLDDDEPFITCAALEVVELLCEHGRDFMRTRIIQLWPRLEEIYREMLENTSEPFSHPHPAQITSAQHWSVTSSHGEKSSRPLSRGVATSKPLGDTLVARLSSRLVSCLTAIVRFVQIPPENIDQALEMLEPALGLEEVQKAFAEGNSDALWLARIRGSNYAKPQLPIGTGAVRWRFSEIPN